MDLTSDDVRARHPYHTIDEIRLQPEVVARSLTLFERYRRDSVDAVRLARRVFVVGCGTSYHAARVASMMFSMFSTGAVDARPMEAFEFAAYGPEPRPGDLVVAFSHRGETGATLQALERAEAAGCPTLLITGFSESRLADHARYVVPTGYGEHRSLAQTAGYTAALTTLAALANALAVPDQRLDLSPLPDVVADVMGLEDTAHRLAAGMALAARSGAVSVIATGAGPNEATAHEAALKLMEMSHLPARAVELEEMMHGSMAAIEPDTVILVIAPDGASTARAATLCRALDRVGVAPVVVCSEGNAEAFPSAHRFVVPDVPEALSPISCIVPLQFLCYYLAVGLGVNPDLGRRDQEQYAAAHEEFG